MDQETQELFDEDMAAEGAIVDEENRLAALEVLADE